jgi:hypothetical protein
MRAAARNRSMEEEARQILRAALQEPITPQHDLGTRLRSRFASFGDVQLPIEAREPLRPPPRLDESPITRPTTSRKTSAARRQRA